MNTLRMKKTASSLGTSYLSRLRRDFLAGIFVIVPLVVTVLIFKWLFESIDGILAPAVEAIFGRPIPGIGFIAIILLVYIAGLIATNVVSGKAVRRAESLLAQVPVIGDIYNILRQISESIMMPHKDGFKEVVLVEFPRPGMRTIGFVTNRIMDSSGQGLVNVYIPTTPNPTSGYLEIIPENDVVHTNISVDEAIKMVVSGGMVSPEVIHGIKHRKQFEHAPKRPNKQAQSPALRKRVPPKSVLSTPVSSAQRNR
jgi:uncharacterized membrane protein